MKEAIEVTLCRDVSLGYRPIVGTLVQYMDGHRACLGQFSLDWTLETIQVERGRGLHIGSGRSKKQFAYVADVMVDPPSDRDELSWIDIPWDGTLEWWFSPRRCILRRSSTGSVR
jgi:hypothetical protein